MCFTTCVAQEGAHILCFTFDQPVRLPHGMLGSPLAPDQELYCKSCDPGASPKGTRQWPIPAIPVSLLLYFSGKLSMGKGTMSSPAQLKPKTFEAVGE